MFLRLFKLGSKLNFSWASEGLKDVNLTGLMKRIHQDEKGQGMTEYIIIIVLVAILVLIVVKAFGKKIKELFSSSTEKLGNETEEAFQGSGEGE